MPKKSNYISKPRPKKVYRVDRETGHLIESTPQATPAKAGSFAIPNNPYGVATRREPQTVPDYVAPQPQTVPDYSATVRRGGRDYTPIQRTARTYKADDEGRYSAAWDSNAQKRLQELLQKESSTSMGAKIIHLTDDEKGELEALTQEYRAFKRQMAPQEQELTALKDNLGKYYRQVSAGHTFDPLTEREEAAKAFIQKRISELEGGDLKYLLPSAYDGVESGAGSVALNVFASPEYLAENTEQVLKDNKTLKQNAEWAAYEEQSAKLSAAITAATDSGDVEKAQEYQERLNAITAQWNTLRNPTPDTGTGAQRMQRAQEMRENAVYGKSSTEKFIGNSAISMAQSATNLVVAGGNPVATAALYGTQAAAAKSKELADRGINSAESLSAGILSGAIEIGTESFSVGTLLDAIKTGGKNVVVQMLKQSGAEASEEAVSYVLNYLADKARNDPAAQFTMKELGLATVGGLFTGAVMGGAGAAIGNTYQQIPNFTDPIPEYTTPKTADVATQVQSAGDTVKVMPGASGDIVTIENGKGKTETVKVNQDGSVYKATAEEVRAVQDDTEVPLIPQQIDDYDLVDNSGSFGHNNNGGNIYGTENIQAAYGRTDDRGVGSQHTDRGDSQTGRYSAAAGESGRSVAGDNQGQQGKRAVGRGNAGGSSSFRVVSPIIRNNLTNKGIPVVRAT